MKCIKKLIIKLDEKEWPNLNTRNKKDIWIPSLR